MTVFVVEGNMSTSLTDGEKQTLLRLAREALEHAVKGQAIPRLDTQSLTPTLREHGASFVTLTIHAELRGCIGALEAYQPLAEDVREHAVSAALQDPRYRPIVESELSRIRLEVSRLTAPHLLEYSSSKDLLKKLKPHVDGVILKNDLRRATFLPQVWEKIPDPVDFLDQLCMKMGASKKLWRDTKLQVYVYQVEEFHE
ncbi:MAG: AmmeMemoRadiSam system protein A [Anaerolineales bacterium]|nr:AmmeMemoRadiSam system protein A [Anaerolineales bacterium]